MKHMTLTLRRTITALFLAITLCAQALAAMPDRLVPCGHTAGIKLYTGGLLITALDEQAPAQRAGLRAGDTILKIDGARVSSVQDASLRLSSGKSVCLSVRRGEKQAEFFTWLYDLEYDKMGLPRPDLVLCLDMPTELAHLLREKRDTQGVGDADIHEHAERYLARCRETARQAAKHYGWTLISCVKDGRLRSIEDIHEEIYRHIAACLEE